jgi:hypothetical protein
LSTDGLGIRQGSREFFRTRLFRAGRTDLREAMFDGKVDLFGGFAGKYVDGKLPYGRLFRFNLNIFTKAENLRTTPGAVIKVE